MNGKEARVLVGAKPQVATLFQTAFCNLIALKSERAELASGGKITFDLTNAALIDHTVREFIDHFQERHIDRRGHCEVQRLEQHEAYSDHPLAGRRHRTFKHEASS